jgi:hypothetical protein
MSQKQLIFILFRISLKFFLPNSKKGCDSDVYIGSIYGEKTRDRKSRAAVRFTNASVNFLFPLVSLVIIYQNILEMAHTKIACSNIQI